MVSVRWWPCRLLVCLPEPRQCLVRIRRWQLRPWLSPWTRRRGKAPTSLPSQVWGDRRPLHVQQPQRWSRRTADSVRLFSQNSERRVCSRKPAGTPFWFSDIMRSIESAGGAIRCVLPLPGRTFDESGRLRAPGAAQNERIRTSLDPLFHRDQRIADFNADQRNSHEWQRKQPEGGAG